MVRVSGTRLDRSGSGRRTSCIGGDSATNPHIATVPSLPGHRCQNYSEKLPQTAQTIKHDYFFPPDASRCSSANSRIAVATSISPVPWT